MKVCITSTGENLDSQIDPRFGRCQYFLVIDTDTMKFESISNKSTAESSGAGIKAAQTVANIGAKVVITGNIGPNAYQTLNAAGINVITDAKGTVKDTIEMYKKGEFKTANNPTVESHSGMNR